MIRTTKLTKVPKTLSLTTGKKYTLKPVVTPSNSQEKVTYKSSNTKIATVSSTGVITAKKSRKSNDHRTVRKAESNGNINCEKSACIKSNQKCSD